MKIINGVNKTDITIEFLDDFHCVKEHCTYNNFKKGQIKNPYDKTHYGIGYLGEGKYVTWENGRFTKVYEIWKSLISRCYGELPGYKAYSGIATICDEWLNFQNFAEWWTNEKYDCDGRLHLDKDILFDGNKEYSPDKCLLVPQKINMLFMDYRPNKDGLPHGIGKAANGRYSSAYRGKSLGVFNTLEKAIAVHDIARLDYINEVTEGQKDTLPIKVYNALKNYVYRQRELMKVA